MADTIEADPPPDSNDLPGWQKAIQDGSFTNFRLEAIVEAIQDLYATAPEGVITALAKYLSQRIYSLLWRVVGSQAQGVEIANEVHSLLWEAILQPTSADGRGLREAFVPRLTFRVKDVLAKLSRNSSAPDHCVREDSSAADGKGKPRRQPIKGSPALDGVAAKEMHLGEVIDVERVLERIANPRKRLVFRMFMDGVPYKSKRGGSIEAATGVSEKTARAWVAEIQAMLATDSTVLELKRYKTGGMS
jgi:hypothetical protein